MASFESFLESMGSFGSYQVLLLLLMTFQSWTTVLVNAMFLVYAAYIPADYLNATTRNGSSPSFQSLVTEWRLEPNSAIPYTITTLQSVAVVIGTPVFTSLSDIYGRRLVWLTASLLTGALGVGSFFADSFLTLATFRVCIGFLFPGLTTTVTTLLCEITDNRHRLIFLQSYILWEVGFLYIAGVAYLTRDWREIIFISNCLILFTLPVFHWVLESPRWLLQKGKMEEALTVMKKIAVRNKGKGADSELTLDALETIKTEAEDGKGIGWKTLVEHRSVLINLSVIMLLFFVCMITWSGLMQDAGQFADDFCLSLFIFGAIKLLPMIAVLYADLRLRIGRRTLFQIGSCGLAVCMTFSAVMFIVSESNEFWESDWLFRGAAVVGSCFLNPTSTALFLLSAEFFPTLIRNRASGMAHTSGRIAFCLSPQLLYLSFFWRPLPAVAFALLSVGLAVLVCCFVSETRNRPMPEILADLKVHHHPPDAKSLLNNKHMQL